MDRENVRRRKKVSGDVAERLKINKFNTFCSDLRVGDVIYNIDNTNLWGDFLVVAVKAPIRYLSIKTWYILLLGVDRKEEGFESNNVRIDLTVNKAGNVDFLKVIGRCKIKLIPQIENQNIHNGLLVTYKDVGLRKYSERSKLRKPKYKKYDKNGELIVRTLDE